MLDEDKVAASAVTVEGDLLFVNTATGRFVRKSLPLLRDYIFVTTTTGGLLVLAATDSPHAMRVLNPFTGSMISFAAPMVTDKQRLAAAVVGSSPTLVLVCALTGTLYWADLQSESFSMECSHSKFAASNLPLIALAAGRQFYSDANNHICRQLRSEKYCRCYVAETVTGDFFLVAMRLAQCFGMDLFKIDSAGNVLERINKSIGSLALFLGHCRSLVVDAERFPTIEANCVYFQLDDPYCHRAYIYRYNIETFDEEQELELVSAAMDNDDSLRPFMIVQLLSNYTVDIHLPLRWDRCVHHMFDYDDDEYESDEF